MRSYKSQALQPASVNDENNIRHGNKTARSGKQLLSAHPSSSDRREVLGDVTQSKNEQIASKNSSITPGLKTTTTTTTSNGVVTSNSKIQIYKQQYKFKKPRLELGQRLRQRQEIPIHSDDDDKLLVRDDEADFDDQDLEYEDIEEEDIEDEENIEEYLRNSRQSQTNFKKSGADANPPATTSNYHNNSEDLLIRKHFDKLTEEDLEPGLSSDLPGETINTTDLVEEDIPYADKENYPDYESVDEEPEEEQLPSQSSKHKPMEPIWTKSVYEELQTIVSKYSRLTLDETDEDTFDVTMVAEYAPEIFNYMHELENRLCPDSRYMDNQDELKWEMRSVLIDWVVQVHSRFNLLPETLFLTVNYIDRFLSKRKVSLSRFQLVGAVALFIAAKYEEINCPTVQEVAYMADNAYSIDDFLKAERFMIDVLEFDMGWPGPMSFLRRTSKADDYDYETRTLAKYFLEITIMDSRFVASQPSWLAAGAHYLSRRILNKGDWSELHVFYSGYTEYQLRPLAEVLLDNCRHAETHHKAIFEKYQERRYRRSSVFVQEYFNSLEYS